MRKEDLMMKFRKNQNKEKQIPKEKKPRVYYKVNPHKKVVIALWVLLGLSFSFAIFKHFTAIDTHTIHETTIIEKEYVDTHHVENLLLQCGIGNGKIILLKSSSTNGPYCCISDEILNLKFSLYVVKCFNQV